MKRTIVLLACAGLLGGIVAVLAGCSHKNKNGPKESAMVTGEPVQEIYCKKCFEEVKKARKAHSKGSQWSSGQVVRQQACPDCQSEMTIEMVEGKLVMKCAKCAPDGVYCDQCRLAKKKK
jgi:hypothetical protein